MSEKLEPPLDGYKRAYVKCERHETVGYYDYVPYSLSNPIMIMPCGCDTKGLPRISEAEAIAAWNQRTQPEQPDLVERYLAVIPYSARTDVVQPVNGSRAYTIVKFREHVIRFDGQNEFDANDYGTDRAAAFAQAINTALAETVRAVLAAIGTAERVVDLRVSGYEQLEEAAGQSNWIPSEYLANDWLSDCAEFLRTGRGIGTAAPQPTASQERAQIVAHIRWVADELEAAGRKAGMFGKGPIAPIETLRELADAIERGDHQQETGSIEP